MSHLTVRSSVSVVALGMLVLFAWSEPTSAKASYLRQLKASYSLPEAANCTYCHNVTKNQKPGKGNLNAYGKDVQAELKNGGIAPAILAVEGKDSDGDGATNVEEIKLGTMPGDKSSTPDAKALADLRKANPPKK